MNGDFESRRRDGTRVVGYGHGRGYAERGYYRGGHPYMRRTYYYGGRSYAYAYRGGYYRGVAYYSSRITQRLLIMVGLITAGPGRWLMAGDGVVLRGTDTMATTSLRSRSHASPSLWITDYLLAANSF